MIVRVTYEVELPKGSWTYDTESREMAYGNMTRQEALDFDFADPYALIEAAEAGALEITGADVEEVRERPDFVVLAGRGNTATEVES